MEAGVARARRVTVRRKIRTSPDGFGRPGSYDPVGVSALSRELGTISRWLVFSHEER